MEKTSRPNLGIGIGLRPIHLSDILNSSFQIDWFEIISEHFMEGLSPLNEALDLILERFPVVQHGVSLSIGSPDPLDFNYLKQLKALAKRTKTPWISDHLSWGRLDGAHYHDLIPLPHRLDVANYVAERLRIVQDFLEIPFALENISSYLSYSQDEMTEWEFYTYVVEKAGVQMMLDINNVYVSSRNQGFDPMKFLQEIPLDKVIQIHLAGHQDHGTYCLDTHDCPVKEDVWALYEKIYPLTGGVSTLLEWDDNYLTFEETCKEALKAKAFQASLLEI